MNELQVFKNEKFGTVRTITENGRTLFCGADVARALRYARPNEAISKHCKGTLKRRIPTNGGMQEMLFIPEGDIYRLAAKSQMKITLDPGAYVPVRAHATDAGLDLKSPKLVYIPPYSSVVIDTGVHVEIPEGYAGMLKSKRPEVNHIDGNKMNNAVDNLE